MTSHPLLLEAVTRLRAATGSDGYGGSVPDWSQTPAEVDIDGCSVQPVEGTEVLDGRAAVVSRWTWFGPEDADVRSSDRLRHRGVTYDIDGSVQRWPDPTGQGLEYASALLRRTDG